MSSHEAAADWLIRLRASPLDLELAGAFDRWLNEGESNRRAFAAVQRSWHLVGEAAGATSEIRPRRARAASRPAGRRGYIAGAVALAACLAVVLAYPAMTRLVEADYRTPAGATLSLDLEDGSRVELGAASAIAVDMTASRRSVRLLEGEAYFVVRSDASRPFTVDAGGVDVTVLGTTFNVRMSEAETDVELAEGRVTLDPRAFAGERIQLSPGQGVHVDRETGRLTRENVALDDIGAWREGRLFVQDTTIGDVVEQLQRYHTAWITVPDSALTHKRVTGLYDLRDPDKALRALVEPHGGRMREVSPYLRILSTY